MAVEFRRTCLTLPIPVELRRRRWRGLGFPALGFAVDPQSAASFLVDDLTTLRAVTWDEPWTSEVELKLGLVLTFLSSNFQGCTMFGFCGIKNPRCTWNHQAVTIFVELRRASRALPIPVKVRCRCSRSHCYCALTFTENSLAGAFAHQHATIDTVILLVQLGWAGFALIIPVQLLRGPLGCVFCRPAGS